MSSPIHFYLTFNPNLNKQIDPTYTQAHEFFDYLKNEVKSHGVAGYAYWGKMIGLDRKSKVDFQKFEEVLKVNSENESTTHLYISDFNNIWVGKVESVHKDIGKDFKALEFYKGKNVEIWFKITDFTLLECFSENTANKLTELYIDNEYMDVKIDEISPFTTGIRYPVFVQDLAEEMYFDNLDTSECSHLIFKHNPAIDNNAILTVLKCIHAFCFPEAVYSKIPHSAKNEIESAEIDILEHRHHNNSRIAFSYIKALEIVVNDLIIQTIKRAGYGDQFFVNPNVMPPKLYLEDRNEDIVPISKFNKNYSINQLIYFVRKCNESKNFCFRKVFNDKKIFVRFILNDLPKLLEENRILEIRGILAHNDSDTISAHDAMVIRNIILGVGFTGIINLLLQAFYQKDYDLFIKIQGVYKSDKKADKIPKRHLKIA